MAFPTWTEALRIVTREISTAGRYESDFVAYRDTPSIVNPVFRYYNSAADVNATVTYNGTWLIDDIGISNGKDKKIIISVTLINISDTEYNWAVRS